MKENKDCTEFTNEEIFSYYVAPLGKELGLQDIFVRDRDKKFFCIHSKNNKKSVARDLHPIGPIRSVIFDGVPQTFLTIFFGGRVSVFIADTVTKPIRSFTFNEEFMFVDDLVKETFSSSETGGNIVYEGNLRNKTHKEILDLLREVTVLLIGATAINVEETTVVPIGGSSRNYAYNICDYVVRITNDTGEKNEAVFDNIKFIINSD